MRRIISTLTLTLAIFSVSYGQNFKREIKDGLYLWSSWSVHQLVSDTLKHFKVVESGVHYKEISNLLPDLFPKWPTDEHAKIKIKRTDKLNTSKVVDILKTGKSKYSIIYPADTGFNSVNYIKRDFGYEMYFSKHDVKRKDLVASIRQDTTSYLMFYAFTITDLKNLKNLKNFNDINQADYEALLKSVEKNKTKVLDYVRENKSYGTIEMFEVIIKGLIELKYNPLIDPGDFDSTKLKPKR